MSDLFTAPSLKVGEGNALFLFDIQTMSREAVRERKQAGEYGQVRDDYLKAWWNFRHGGMG